MTNPNVKLKKPKPCLKCDVVFMTTPEKRICPACSWAQKSAASGSYESASHGTRMLIKKVGGL